MKITIELHAPVKISREAGVEDHRINRLINGARDELEPSKTTLALKNTRRRMAEGLVGFAQKLLED